jgi:hypothetical protein
MSTGAFIGEKFSGGFIMPSELHKGRVYITPNLTPDPTTGWIRTWSQQDFLDRFHQGRIYDDSPMPWASFGNFTDRDLKALYAYLHTLPAVKKDNGKTMIEK